jgi:dTDP-4-amino-4,6-dideoxygalactose transaminase
MTQTINAEPVPYVDLAAQHAPLKAEILAAVERVLDRGDFILGAAVEEFETRLAALIGVRFAIGVGNGTDALQLSLRALDIGPGDEVITPPNSFVASTSCIRLAGAMPVFVDVDETYNIDPDKIEAAITPRTKALMPVHLTGRAANMERILAIAAKHKLPIVEDSAQAILAEFDGKRTGSTGTFGCFSLHPLKTLNACGDGGVVTTNDPQLAARVRILRNLGLQTRDDCAEWSVNSRLDALQAAILLVKLDHLEAWTQARRANAQHYRERLANVPGLTLPTDSPRERQVYHTFVVQAERREALRAYLSERGIGTSVHYPVPIHLHTAARELGHQRGAFPVTERQADRILSLPVHNTLRPDQLDRVAATIRQFYEESR